MTVVILLLAAAAARGVLQFRGTAEVHEQGNGYLVARATSSMLKAALALLTLTALRAWDTWTRATWLVYVLPLDHKATFHKAAGWALCGAAVVHVVTHVAIGSLDEARTSTWVRCMDLRG